MNNPIRNLRTLSLHTAGVAALTLLAGYVQAQDTTTTSVRHGSPTIETTVRNAQIVYVEGNDLVLKLENGKVEHLVIPASEKFNVEGHEVTVDDLKVGSKLTQTITTTATPRYVNTVRTIKGKVWHVNAPGSMIISLPEGGNVHYRVPSHAKFIINGKPKTVFDLRKGMMVEATIVTDSPETVVQSNKVSIAQAPAPATPVQVGVLLIQAPEPTAAAPAPVETASLDSPAAELPKTASYLPLAGLLGLLGIGSSVALGVARKRIGA
jgi:hypothetical protein